MSNEAIHRALVDIAELERDGHISANMARSGRRVVDLVFDHSTVYASVGPVDDGDLSFYWCGDDWSVSIDIGDDAYWAAVRKGSGVEPLYFYGKLDPSMRRHVKEFSRQVQFRNPSWRDMGR